MADKEIELIKNIHDASQELDAAREVVRTLANDLADVADVIEPVLADQAKRIRAARMSVIDECRQVATALREFRESIGSPSMTHAIEMTERFVVVFEKLEEFRACGFLDAYVEMFAKMRSNDAI